VELSKDWRTDRLLRRLEALLVVADRESSLIAGHRRRGRARGRRLRHRSGRQLRARRGARWSCTRTLDARAIVEEALRIAARICVYTNDNLAIEELDAGSDNG
jgi:ATP-dependent HslUV protease subunit HslV